MEYALYFTGLCALIIGFRFYRKRKVSKRLDDRYIIRSFKEGSDPFDDRIEFHCRDRRR